MCVCVTLSDPDGGERLSSMGGDHLFDGRDHREQHWFISLLDARQPLNFWIHAAPRRVPAPKQMGNP
jgi:hypothetical protein